MEIIKLIFLIVFFILVKSKLEIKKKGITNIGRDTIHIGVNDHQTHTFDGQFPIPNGISHNSFLVRDSKIIIIDVVDRNFLDEWIDNINKAMKKGEKPYYLIVQHFEPEQIETIKSFMKIYNNTIIVSSGEIFSMMYKFFGLDYFERRIIIDENSTILTGNHSFSFILTPIKNWPEIIITHDSYSKTTFTGDIFGKFGSHDVEEPWSDEARRYFLGYAVKYGDQLVKLLKKLNKIDIDRICPSHGPIIDENLKYYFDLYSKWANYEYEEEGIIIAYISIYGNTKETIDLFIQKLREKKAPKVVSYDLTKSDPSYVVSDAFKYSNLVLFTNSLYKDIFPKMKNLINHLKLRNFQKRTITLIESGYWTTSNTINTMKSLFSGCKDIKFTKNNLIIHPSLIDKVKKEIEKLSNELCSEYIAHDDNIANKMNLDSLDMIGYGLYLLTTKDGEKDNGCIVNRVIQISYSPGEIAVSLNKKTYSNYLARLTYNLNLNILKKETPFSLIQKFGTKTGREIDKFKNEKVLRTDNGLVYLPEYINSVISLKVINFSEMGSHNLYVCKITESRVFNADEPLSYAFYQSCIKPKPDTTGKQGFICKVCGYIHEGKELPADFLCPFCKHCTQDFVEIENDD